MARKATTLRPGNGNGAPTLNPGDNNRLNAALDALEGAEEKGAKGKVRKVEKLEISPLKEEIFSVNIKGTAPLMMLRFSEKAIKKMMETQMGGSTSKSKKNREPRDFDADGEAAKHLMQLLDADGQPVMHKGAPKLVVGIPAAAFRNAMISACRLVGFKMTIAKMSVFVEADGIDTVDGVPLVKLDESRCSEPQIKVMPVRNANGVADLRARPQWKEWGCSLRVKYDGDQFKLRDVVNLLVRAGAQVGIGEGRPDSRESAGLGFGTFTVLPDSMRCIRKPVLADFDLPEIDEEK